MMLFERRGISGAFIVDDEFCVEIEIVSSPINVELCDA